MPTPGSRHRRPGLAQVVRHHPAVGALTATAVSDHQVILSWGAATDNAGVTDYAILRAGQRIGSVDRLTYSDTSATGGQTYTYAVEARDAAGNVGPASNSTTVTTPLSLGGPVRIAAAGDIACASGALVTATTCQQWATSELLVAGELDRVLTLGDNLGSRRAGRSPVTSGRPSRLTGTRRACVFDTGG